MSDRDQQDEPETFTTCGEVFLCSIHEIPQPCMRDVGHPGSHRSKRDQQDEQATCFACGRGQAGDKHTCQQDECPKAFYCLPESCGDCPDQQLPCEGCPDPGMPCLGCPSVDEQAKRDPIIDRYVFERMSPARGMSALVHKDNANAAIIMAVREARAEGERAATERILERIDQSLHVYREHAGARGALYALRCRVADAIERVEHEQR